MFIVYFLFVRDTTPTSNTISCGDMTRFIFSTTRSTTSLLYENTYTPKVAVRLDNILKCLPYHWTIKDE